MFSRYNRHEVLFNFLDKYPILYITFILIGVYTVIGAILKPNFFWNSKESMKIRNKFGDETTTFFYIFSGVFLCIFGFFAI